MRSSVLAIAGVVAGLATSTAATASANVVSGSLSDPQGDSYKPYGVYPSDIKSFGLRYDSDAGQLTTSINIYDEVGSPQADYEFGAQIGVWNKKRHACGVQSVGAATVTVVPSGDAPVDYDTAHYSVVGYNDGAEQTFLVHSPLDKWFEPAEYQLPLDRTRFDRITDVAAFAGRGYNCVSTAVLHNYAGSEDHTKTFCMSPSGTIACKKLRN